MSIAHHLPEAPARRVEAAGSAVPRRSRLHWRDGDVLVMLLAFWIASLVRVIGAGVRHEVFGTEATLAFMALVAIPVIVFRARPRAQLPRAPRTRPRWLRVVHKGASGRGVVT